MICLDIDGVIANTYPEVNRWVEEAGWKGVPMEEWSSYKLADIPGFKEQSIPHKFFQGLYKNKLFYKNAIPYEDAWYFVNHYAQTEKIVAVTARAAFLEGVTWDWFMDWDIPVDEIHFVNHGVKSEIIIAKCEGARAFVEDRTENAAEAADAGINSFLLNRPYNADGDNGKAKRIDSLWEVS